MVVLKFRLALCLCVFMVLPSALSLRCRSGYRACKDGIFCIRESWVCDDEEDCFDGSDEAGCKCGIRKMDSPTLSLIIGGTQAANGEFPWHVGVWINGAYKCGGAYIKGYVLTTAGCVTTKIFGQLIAYAPGVIKVRLGTTKRTYYDSRRVIASVCSVFLDLNNYNGNFPYLGNFALLKLCSSVPHTYTIHPVCLPGLTDDCSHEEDNDETCYTTGWGRTSRYSYGNTQYLQKTRAWIQPISKCIANGYTSLDPRTQLCVETDGKNCYGDFGGPITCRDRRGQWSVRGFFSYMKANCVSTYSIYTSVCPYRASIIRTISNS